VSIENNLTEDDPFLSLKQSVGDNNLKLGHLNINGLFHKLCEVKHLLNFVNFDLLGITKTILFQMIGSGSLDTTL